MQRAILPPDGFEPGVWDRELLLLALFVPLICRSIHCPMLILFASAAVWEWSLYKRGLSD